MIKELLEQDDGGRRVHAVGLECGAASPAHAVSSLGSASFREPLARTAAETHLSSDSRIDRQRRGHVPWSTEPHVPDVGGLGWRTRAGHLLKNQSFYPQTSKQNLWDNPTFAGVNTWKEFHGPKMRADAEIMDRLDRFDQDQDEWEAKKTFVNTMRVQTLDRFYNRKLNRTQLSTSASWAPHRKSRKEVHDYYATFDGAMDEKPRKELKKVYTEKVLASDREAIRNISKRVQNEETWKQVFKQMEAERRADLRADLQQRQAHTDRLMALSGQPVKSHLPPGVQHRSITNSSMRNEELSVPRPPSTIKDVCANSDFRGLIHADNGHALEALFPGSGHELSVEFRARATASTQAGWPPPAPPETPKHGKKETREDSMRRETSISKLSIPSSTQRMEKIGARMSPEEHKEHAKVQFLSTTAPPAPDQKDALLEEDWSPTTTLNDPGRVTGSFTRTGPSSPSHKMEFIPPPIRSYTYGVMVPSSPDSKSHGQNGMGSTMSLRTSLSAPGLHGDTSMMGEASALSFGGRSASSAGGAGRRSVGGVSAEKSTRSVCDELDDFEARASALAVPRISNFYGPPRATGAKAQARAKQQGRLS